MTTTLVLVGYLLGSIPFKGGTGVATTFGVFTLLSPLAAAFAAGVFGVAVCTTRSSSVVPSVRRASGRVARSLKSVARSPGVTRS